MQVLLSTDFWRMEEDSSLRLVFLKRTSTKFLDINLLKQQNGAVISQIRTTHKSFGIVVDMREAPMRNDPEFESAMETLRSAIRSGYARTAVLISTGVGVLQINRLTREDGSQTFATRSEVDAVEFARGLK